MPKWLHERAKHILVKNPSMPKSEAFAIATQQSHALGKTPKGYGTPTAKWEAKEKYETPMDDEHTANPKSPKVAALLEELHKVGAITDEEARRSLDRLDSLDRSKPTLSQASRYALIGATAGPAVRAATNLIRGKSPLDFAQAAGKSPLRGLAADALGGATMAGAVPMLRSHFDRSAETGTLKKYMKQHELQQHVEDATPNPVAPIKQAALSPRMGSVLRRASWDVDKQTLNLALSKKNDASEKLKAAFQQSMYGSTGGFVDFHQVSGQPGFKKPSLASPIAVAKQKEAALTSTGLTPAARLSSGMRIGKPKVSAPAGPSISDIAKPTGYGMKLPGATKSA